MFKEGMEIIQKKRKNENKRENGMRKRKGKSKSVVY